MPTVQSSTSDNTKQTTVRELLPRRVTLRFRLPYYTQWGQNLIVSGSNPAFGSWNIKQGLSMKPHHENDTLNWHAELLVPDDFESQYQYCLVDENKNLIKRESGDCRDLNLPSDLPDGAVIDFYDSWQDGCPPETLLKRGALRNVIFEENDDNNSECCTRDIPNKFKIPPQDKILVRFHVNCVHLKSGERVHLFGNASGLGKWETEVALKLDHTGAFSWQGECFINKEEFPLEYPQNIFLDNKIPLL